jgi:hypothetical protein
MPPGMKTIELSSSDLEDILDALTVLRQEIAEERMGMSKSGNPLTDALSKREARIHRLQGRLLGL